MIWFNQISTFLETGKLVGITLKIAIILIRKSLHGVFSVDFFTNIYHRIDLGYATSQIRKSHVIEFLFTSDLDLKVVKSTSMLHSPIFYLLPTSRLASSTKTASMFVDGHQPFYYKSYIAKWTVPCGTLTTLRAAHVRFSKFGELPDNGQVLGIRQRSQTVRLMTEGLLWVQGRTIF